MSQLIFTSISFHIVSLSRDMLRETFVCSFVSCTHYKKEEEMLLLVKL